MTQAYVYVHISRIDQQMNTGYKKSRNAVALSPALNTFQYVSTH